MIGVVCGLVFFHQRDKELIKYAQKHMEIEALREDYVNRDPVEFIETIPDVRGAVNGATADFERRRDEILQRFRNRIAD